MIAVQTHCLYKPRQHAKTETRKNVFDFINPLEMEELVWAFKRYDISFYRLSRKDFIKAFLELISYNRAWFMWEANK